MRSLDSFRTTAGPRGTYSRTPNPQEGMEIKFKLMAKDLTHGSVVEPPNELHTAGFRSLGVGEHSPELGGQWARGTELCPALNPTHPWASLSFGSRAGSFTIKLLS